MKKKNNLCGVAPGHHIDFGPKSNHMAILERMYKMIGE
jgi:hypothetical protein